MFGWLKKLKKTKSHDNPVDGTAEDALESSLAQRLADPNPNLEYVSANFSSNHPAEPKRATIAFEKGPSESKGQIQRSSVKQQTQINVNKQSPLNTQYQHRASSNTPAKSTEATITRSLYPCLDLSSVEKHGSRGKRKAPQVKEEVKTIHDIAREIPFAIEPKLQDAGRIENKFALLDETTQPGLQLIEIHLKKSLQYEYDFGKEFDVIENYAHITVFKKLHSFYDVEKCHKMANKPLEYEATKDSKTDPLFKDYYQKFRCYKGKKGDVICCD